MTMAPRATSLPVPAVVGTAISGSAQTEVLKPSGGVTLPDGGAGLTVSDAEKQADVRRFLDELLQVSDVRVVILRLSGLRVLDASGANALAQVVGDLQRRGVVVLLKGLPPQHRRLVEAVGVLDALQHERHLFATLPEAIEHARSHVRRATAATP